MNRDSAVLFNMYCGKESESKISVHCVQVESYEQVNCNAFVATPCNVILSTHIIIMCLFWDDLLLISMQAMQGTARSLTDGEMSCTTELAALAEIFAFDTVDLIIFVRLMFLLSDALFIKSVQKIEAWY